MYVPWGRSESWVSRVSVSFADNWPDGQMTMMTMVTMTKMTKMAIMNEKELKSRPSGWKWMTVDENG